MELICHSRKAYLLYHRSYLSFYHLDPQTSFSTVNLTIMAIASSVLKNISSLYGCHCLVLYRKLIIPNGPISVKMKFLSWVSTHGFCLSPVVLSAKSRTTAKTSKFCKGSVRLTSLLVILPKHCQYGPIGRR